MSRSLGLLAFAFALVAVTAMGVGGSAVVRADDAHAAADDHDHGDHAHGGVDGEADHPAGEEPHETHGDDGHAVDYNKPPLEVDPRLLVWSLVVFLGFVFLAKRMAWVPLIEGLDARESRVNRALADAEAARVQALALLDEHKARMDQVTEEVKEIIAKSRTEAEAEKTRVIAEAEQEATEMRDQAIADIQSAREEALSGVDGQIDSQVEMARKHVLG